MSEETTLHNHVDIRLKGRDWETVGVCGELLQRNGYLAVWALPNCSDDPRTRIIKCSEIVEIREPSSETSDYYFLLATQVWEGTFKHPYRDRFNLENGGNA